MLLYLAVSNFKGIVLSELPLKSGGTFRDIVHEVLDSGSLPTEDTLVSYTAGEYRFHVLVDTGVRYCCLAEEIDGNRIPALVLQDMMDAFREKYGIMGKHATEAGAMRSDFQVVMESIHKKYKDPANVDKVRRLRDELEKVRDAAMHSIDLAVDRGEQVESMQEKTSLLSKNSQMFADASTKLRREMWWRMVKTRIAIGAGVVHVEVRVYECEPCADCQSLVFEKKRQANCFCIGFQTVFG